MATRSFLKTSGVALFCVALLSGCNQDAQENEEATVPRGPQVELKKVDRRVADANNEFGFEVLRQLNDGGTSGNILISPMSLSLSLSMLYNGAAGQTQKAMAETLRWGALPLAEINNANAAIHYNLQTAIPNNDPQIQIAIANSLWAQQDVTFEKDFLERNKKFYKAEISSLDLSTPAALEAINSWVKENTKGKIEQIFTAPPDPDTRLVLINAVYLNGQWQSKFEKSATLDDDFHLTNGGTQTVPMMSQEGHFSYAKGSNFSAVELPYGDGDLAMLLVLPDKGVRLETLLSRSSKSPLSEWTSAMSPQDGTVWLPRFKMEYESILNNSLKALGMAAAFDPAQADFTKMRSQKDLHVSEVRQKAVIEVNEEGTEAAAVTAIHSNTTSVDVPDDEPFEFKADRPFLGVIREQRSGAILSLVVVRDPQ